MDNTHIKKVTAITRVFGEGQKTVAAAVEYDAELRAEDVDKRAFAVEGRRVTDAYVSASAAPERAARGCFVILELDRTDAGINTMVARPPVRRRARLHREHRHAAPRRHPDRAHRDRRGRALSP